MAHRVAHLKGVRNNPRDVNVVTLGLIALGGFIAWQNIPEFQAAIKGIAGKVPVTGGGTGGGGGILAVDEGQIRKWASDIRLSYEVGRRFVAEHGRLPNSIDELVSWGNRSGYRLPDTRWVI